MGNSRNPKRASNRKMEERRPVRRHQKKWEDDVRDDTRTFLDVQDWKKMALNKEGWRWKLEEARPDLGCRAIVIAVVVVAAMG